MSQSDVWGKAWQRVQDGAVSALTGEPPEGSLAAKQKQLQELQLQKQIDELARNPNDPAARRAFLDYFAESQNLIREERRSIRNENLDTIVDPRTLQGAQFKLDLENQRRGNETDNELRKLETKFGKQTAILDKLHGHERALMGGSQADLVQQALAFAAERDDKFIAAQEKANSLGKTIQNFVPSLATAALLAFA